MTVRHLGLGFTPLLLLAFLHEVAAEEPTGYLYCPTCGFETPDRRGKDKVTMLCPRCGKKKQVLQYSRYSHGTSSDDLAPSNALVPIIGFGVPIALAGIWLVLSKRWLSRFYVGLFKPKIARSICKCPSCHRKIGYLPSQRGHRVTCPQCKEPFILPL
jgi:predicted RNA-binding Zn-ribbon protein involved in translation (DUF1610 family)